MSTTERDASRASAAHRPPPWRDIRVLRAVLQAAFVVLILYLFWYFYGTLVVNLQVRGIRTDFGFLRQPAGFAILGSDFSSREPIWRAMVVGVMNTLRVSLIGIVLAVVLGLVIGVARLSSNWLVRKAAAAFVESLRNVPLLVLIIFFYIAVLQALPRIGDAVSPLGIFVLSNRGLYAPWLDIAEGSGVFLAVAAVGLVAAVAVARWRTKRFDATGEPHRRVLWGGAVFLVVAGLGWLLLDRPVAITVPSLDGRRVDGGAELALEYGALLIALFLYTAAFIAEIVRGSILSVPRGQGEAANALGLSAFQRFRYVVLPQALRVATPPTGSEFLNLTKNSALGIAIAFPETLRISRIAIGQGMPAPQLTFLMLSIFLVISLVLSALVNLVNRSLQLKER